MAEQQSRRPGRTTLLVSLFLVLALGAYSLLTWQAGKKQEKINEHLLSAKGPFGRDTCTGYYRALEHYRAIIELDPDHPEALARAAFACTVLAGEFDEPKKLLQEGNEYLARALAFSIPSIMLTAAQGIMSLYAQGDTDESVKHLQNALKEHPKSPMLHTALGTILLEKGRLGPARKNLLQGAAQGDVRAYFGLGLFAAQRSMLRESTQAFLKTLQTSSLHTRALLHRGLVILRYGNFPGANLAARAILHEFYRDHEADSSPREDQLANMIGVILELRSEDKSVKAKAPARLKKFLHEHSDSAYFHFLAAREMRREGRTDAALAYITTALEINAGRPDFLLEDAAIRLERGDLPGARSSTRRARDIDPEDGRAYILEGDAYFHEKKYEEAKKIYKDATRYDRVAGLAYYMLGKLFLSLPIPDKDQARANLELAMTRWNSFGGRGLTAWKEAYELLKELYPKEEAQPKEEKWVEPPLGDGYCRIAQYFFRSHDEKKHKRIKELIQGHCRKCIGSAQDEDLKEWCRKYLEETQESEGFY